jgi:hypothetical protein
VERLVIELRQDVRFEQGAWQPVDERTRILTGALAQACSAPARLFSRSAAALDRERVALGSLAADLPDLNLFYVVEGDAAELARQELVAEVSPARPVLGAAPDRGPLPERAAVVRPAPGRLHADELDRAAAPLGKGDLLVVPDPIVGRAAWAAAELAARRGVRVLVIPEGEAPAWARHVVLVSRSELAATARHVADGARTGRARRVRVTLDSLLLVSGGDRVESELYLEGWIDDAGERFPFRVPPAGALGGVRRGQPVALGAVIHRGRAHSDTDLGLHLEVWEQDQGRASLIDPDDLLGIHEARFTEGDRWGEGLHEGCETAGGEGACRLTYRIELLSGTE